MTSGTSCSATALTQSTLSRNGSDPHHVEHDTLDQTELSQLNNLVNSTFRFELDGHRVVVTVNSGSTDFPSTPKKCIHPDLSHEDLAGASWATCPSTPSSSGCELSRPSRDHRRPRTRSSRTSAGWSRRRRPGSPSRSAPSQWG